jgi:hypothetical protein
LSPPFLLWVGSRPFIILLAVGVIIEGVFDFLCVFSAHGVDYPIRMQICSGTLRLIGRCAYTHNSRPDQSIRIQIGAGFENACAFMV